MQVTVKKDMIDVLFGESEVTKLFKAFHGPISVRFLPLDGEPEIVGMVSTNNAMVNTLRQSALIEAAQRAVIRTVFPYATMRLVGEVREVECRVNRPARLLL